jgi:hypothetical protein
MMRSMIRWTLAGCMLLAAAVAVIDFSPATAGAQPSVITFFVDAARGSDDGPGTEAGPFSTIGVAVEAARNVGGPVHIDVRSGIYSRETFPIVVDFDDCTIRAVPSSPGQGQEVRIVAAPPLGPENAMLAIAAADVKLEGLWFDAGGAVGFPNFPNYAIYIDGAQGFSIDGVKAQGAFLGLFARRSSGEIVASHFTLNSGPGSLVAAGTTAMPAEVRYEGNLVDRNMFGGAFFSATLRSGFLPPNGVPVPPADPAPSRLDLDMGYNLITHNLTGGAAAGAQFFLHLGEAAEVSEPGEIVAHIHHNTIAENGFHDVAVGTHRDDAACTAPASFTGTFTENTYSDDPSKNIFGFNFRFCDGTVPVNDGTIALIDAGNELAGFVYDATGTRNVLTHNGAVLTGTNRPVPCPPADCNGE